MTTRVRSRKCIAVCFVYLLKSKPEFVIHVLNQSFMSVKVEEWIYFVVDHVYKWYYVFYY